jgi:hypothetical protein
MSCLREGTMREERNVTNGFLRSEEKGHTQMNCLAFRGRILSFSALRRMIRLAIYSLCLVLLQGSIAHSQPEHTGQSQQPLVTPRPPIDQQTQEQFGLLTLSNPEGTCSASMLNDYWAITAAHCVFSQKGSCPQFMPNQISLRANWFGNVKTMQALQVISYGTPFACPGSLVGAPSDVAIVQVGRYGLERQERDMKLHDQRPMANLTVTAYGRGIDALAFWAGSNAVPTHTDGQYRSADFSIDSVDPNSSAPPVTYSYAGNRGATAAAGDSGGPSYIQEWDDPLSPRRKLEWRLMGVHSFCYVNCLRGKSCGAPNPWTWVASVTSCSDASILPVRSAILAAIEGMPADTVVYGPLPTSTPDAVLKHKRALYAMSIDEPLVAPPGAAIDIQLTFQMCSLRVSPACPVTPEIEQWSYDPATHRLYHTASGKCVNISGARHDAGSPIILYPCSGGSNEKWTVVERAGSAVWSIKSDLTGMCLHVQPGRAGGHDRQRIILPTPATLVQMPCDGSAAQRFSNVDADWSRRNGPR